MKLASISCLLLALALGAASGPARAAGTNNAPSVGHLREFDRFGFKGNTSFSAENLWFGLNANLDFSERAHPLAPRDEFLAAVQSRLLLGYQHCGFPDVRITARYDPKADRVAVQVKEGPRYWCGPVEVIGARQVLVPPIVKALTVTNADSRIWTQTFQFQDNAPVNREKETDPKDWGNQNFLWASGQPGRFDDISLRVLAGLVTNTLARQGFFSARFSLKVVPNSRARTATLQVKILDEGPPATIGHIDVVGNRRNSSEVVLDYLGLKPGMRFTSDLEAAVNDRLYHSARFLTNAVLVGKPDASGRLFLAVGVVENDRCSPLNVELEPMEKALLQTRDWFAKLGDAGEDAVITFSGFPDENSTFQGILAPHQGLLVLDNETVAGTNRLCHATVLSAGRLALYVPGRQQKLRAPLSMEQVQSYVTVETYPPDPEGNCANFLMGAGFQSVDDSTKAPPFTLSISLAPAAFVRLAHFTNFACWQDGNQIICSNADAVLKLDARTGRLIVLDYAVAKTPGGPKNFRLNLHFEPNAFAAALGRIERDGAGFAEAYDTNAPFSSSVAFLGSEVMQAKFAEAYLQARLPAATRAALPELVRWLGTEDFLAPFKSLKDLVWTPDQPAGEFQVPEQPRPGPGGPFGNYLTVLAQAVLAGSDTLFPVNSWPWTTARDVAFVYRGHRKYVQSDMHEIYLSSKTGPIGFLVTAEFLKGLAVPLSKANAARGLERLSADDFRRDCRVLLDENKLCGRLAAALAAAVRNLDQRQLDALVQPLTPAQAEFIRDCARRLRATNPEQPLFETIAPALETWWDKELKQATADHLKQLANQ